MKLTIERLGHLGDGIAEGPIFVPMTLPGEVVEGDIEGDQMLNPRILTPSPDRVRAPCPHFKACGGCLMQHASDGFVAAWKQDIVRTALKAQGIETVFREIQTSPPQSRRRASLSGTRTKKGATVGFHGRASGTIVPIPSCKLLHPDLMAAIPALEQLTVTGGSRKGEISFSVTRSAEGLDVLATAGKPLDGSLRIELATMAERFGLARLEWDGELVAQHMPPAQRFGKASVVPPPGAFLQATEQGEAALLAAVVETVGDARRVADLFAGCGTFALPLAAKAEVLAVESEAPMVAALDQGWRMASGLKRVTTETRDLFRRPLYPDELKRFDAVVIDPPRAGAEAQIEQIARSSVPVIAAVSCNPVTFARDAKILLDAGYTLNWVQVVDQFRWSSHVELVASFSKDQRAKR